MFEDKKILVIGGTGTIGKRLVLELMHNSKAKTIRIFSRDEHKQFLMQHDISDPQNRLRFLIGDVRDKDRLAKAMEDVDIVFALAAMKHVPACEYNPFEAVKTNVIGTQNVIECAISQEVEKVIYTSTDKAASPTNTMGATKLLAERLMSAANYYKGPHDVRFASTRFGNVLNSRGSVIPTIRRQIQRHLPVTITEPDMTRFIMSPDKAVALILRACDMAIGGETFVFKMPVVRIGDMVEEYVNLLDNGAKMVKIGKRPGEKMYEELMTEEESMRALETENMFIVLPYHMDNGRKYVYPNARRAKVKLYTSNDYQPLSRGKLREMLKTIMNDEEMEEGTSTSIDDNHWF